MGFVEFVFGITFISIITGGLVRIASMFFGPRGKSGAPELRDVLDRLRTLEAQLLDSHRQNESLRTQLEWHTKLLETQDRLLNQLPEAASPAMAR